MKKLNEKEMAKVAGGFYGTISLEDLERHKGSPVDKYDGWEGNTYIFDDGHQKYIGKLIESYETPNSLYGTTQRIHKIQVIDAYGYNPENGSTITLIADGCQIYEYVE